MSVIEEALFTILKDSAAIGALCGDRIYPQVIPQGGTMPAITYDRISGPRIWALDGADGVATPRFQINCWAEHAVDVWRLETAVRELLSDYTGTVLGVSIGFMILEDSDDLFEPAVGQNDRRRYGRRMDWVIWHEE